MKKDFMHYSINCLLNLYNMLNQYEFLEYKFTEFYFNLLM